MVAIAYPPGLGLALSCQTKNGEGVPRWRPGPTFEGNSYELGDSSDRGTLRDRMGDRPQIHRGVYAPVANRWHSGCDGAQRRFTQRCHEIIPCWYGLCD